jgi:sugar lactone lactonase YvrE
MARPRLKLVLRTLGSCLLLLVVYLCLWPVDVDPAAWTPSPAPARSGVLARNDALAAARLLHPELPGPESLAFDASGAIVAGLGDGRVVRIAGAGAGAVTTIGNTGGRPLGIKLDAEGRIVIADAHRGLLRMTADGKVEVLARSEGGKPFAFTDDLAIARDGTIYFSDASFRRSVEDYRDEIVEHRPSGRLLSWSPASKQVKLVLGGLYFPNGVALGPDDAYVLVAETASYRIQRLWLTGRRAGQHEVFVDDLPGFPDNLTWSPERQVFWVAIGSPRSAPLDALAGRPFLRKVVLRLPSWLQPAPEQHAWVVAYDLAGRPALSLEHVGADAYASVASVIEHDRSLYLGSFSHPGLARVAVPGP